MDEMTSGELRAQRADLLPAREIGRWPRRVATQAGHAGDLLA